MFLLYGAYGYTGTLIAHLARRRGMDLMLSGRDPGKLADLAYELRIDYRPVDLKDTEKLRALVRQYPVVLHAAGPFAHTAEPMMEACIREGVHYLDITGEIPVFAMAARKGAEAERAGVMLMPGVGFDVVPTDCTAAFLKARMPTATELTLAFAWKGGGISRGTAKTMLMGAGGGGAVRRHGKIERVPAAYDVREFPFTEAARLKAVTIPWGDVFTAYHTTGIPNITTYFAAPSKQIKMMKRSRYLGPLLSLGPVQKLLSRRIDRRAPGPDAERRAKAESYIYGEVSDVSGRRVAARLRTPEGYTLTADTALRIVQRVLNGKAQPGYQTPAGLYGPNLIMEVEGTHREVIEG